MPMDFPASPTVGQVYNGYVWSGVAWESANPQTISLTGQVIVANQTARDALYPSPVQGNAVFRSDTGAEETYYGLYNVSTNPGGRATAGWYTNPSVGFWAAAASATGNQFNNSYTDWNGPVSITFTKTRAATRLVVTGICHYSPQNVTTDTNYIAVNIAGSDYQLLQFNSGTQYSLQQRTGVTVITGLAPGTYTAKLRYATFNNLYTVNFANSFLTVEEVV